MTKYNNIIIYLMTNTEGDSYIGFTRNIEKLKYTVSKNSKNQNLKYWSSPFYTCVREKGIHTFDFRILEQGDYESLAHVEDSQRKYYEEYKPTLNKRKPRKRQPKRPVKEFSMRHGTIIVSFS